MSNKSVWEKILDVDVRIIRWAIVILTIVPLLYPLGLPIPISARNKQYYDVIMAVEPGSIILVNYGMEMAAWGEVGVTSIPIVQHLFKLIEERQIKLIFTAFKDQSPPIVDKVLATVDKENVQYGTDWVWLGYMPGEESAIAVFGEDIRQAVLKDYYGTSLDDLPLMNDINTAEDFDLVVSFNHMGNTQAMVRQWYTRYETAIIEMTLGLHEVQSIPFLLAGQYQALMTGIRGGAEYEKLTKNPGLATSMMDSQATSHMVFAAAIFIGNIAYFLAARARKIKGM